MIKYINLIGKFIKNNKYFLLLILFYFLIRLINLTKLPIFNDESIYLDWGWREINVPGYLYYSLYDAKQPFLMWIFGIAEVFIKDPLFAGRIVSVFCGFLSLLGIYKLSQKLFNNKAALLAVLFYIVIPIFSFYNRLALMESAVSAVGIWTSLFLINLFDKKNFKSGIYLGIVLGIGFLVKSSSLVFLFSYLILTVYLFKLSSKKTKIFEIIFVSLSIFLSVIILLLINPLFWDTLKTNSRFTLTIAEIFALPIGTWTQSIIINFRILFFYITPFVFLSSIAASIYIFPKNRNFKIFIIFFSLCLLIETFTVRGSTDRYIFPFIAFLVIPFSRVFFIIYEKNKRVAVGFFVISFLIPFSITIYQIISPPSYLLFMDKISGYGNSVYLNGYTSGYGINETVNYFNSIGNSKKIVIGIAENTGNPESAINIYFNKSKNIQVVYFDSRLFNMDLSKLDCLKSNLPVYFVSRDDQLVGLDKFLEKVMVIRNPYGVNTIGIYRLKENCKGNFFKLELNKII